MNEPHSLDAEIRKAVAIAALWALATGLVNVVLDEVREAVRRRREEKR